MCVCTHCHSVTSESLQLPGSSVHGILEARILEWVAIPFYRGSSQPRDQNPCLTHHVSGGFFTTESTQEHYMGSIHVVKFLLNSC